MKDDAIAFVGAKYSNEATTVRITESTTLEGEKGWSDAYKYERISGSLIEHEKRRQIDNCVMKD